MALTAAQWFSKLKKFVPGWIFEKDVNSQAIFQAEAAVCHQIQQDTDDAQTSTFITDAVAPVLDLHGDERSLPRNTGELDAAYSARVQNCLFVPVGETQLQLAIDQQLNNGSAFLIENEQYGFLDDADVSETPGIPYCDDYYTRVISGHKWCNWWTVIIPIQTAGSAPVIQAGLIAAIESNKALGTTYDVLYESSSDTDTDD